MRAAYLVLALASAVGCAELGVVTDGSSISYGRPSRGRLIDGVKLPDSGPGYTTAPVWAARGNRYGTNELVTMLKSVSRKMKQKSKDARLVIADLSGSGGGAADKFHKSHQTGRDVDLLYYIRDAEGKPVEASVMHVLDPKGVAKDGSGITLDVPRTWTLVRELLIAQEAYVQYVFMYRPLAEMLIEHATKVGEPEHVIARATKALKQPGDSAPHNDHMHVRIYCPPTDRMFGCVDIGPLELLAEREAEAQAVVTMIAQALPAGDGVDDVEVTERTAADVWKEAANKPATSLASVTPSVGASIGSSVGSSVSSSVSVGSPTGPVGSSAAATVGSSAVAGATPLSTLRAGGHRVELRGTR